ncbi:MAG: translocation/assembly module TamB [Muribaculaceae bacterium]|nr:translocation/assembly module TamB [Muribaculaceae bacterium]
MHLAAGIYRVVRAVVVTAILCAVGIPAILYIALSLPSVQGEVRNIGQRELSKLLTTDVSIGDLAFSPFNRITLFNVKIADDNGQEAVTVSRLGAGISLSDLIFRRKIVVNYAEIIGFDGHINRIDKDSPINIANIIDHLKSQDNKKKSNNIELSVNTIVLRQCSFSYDVFSEPTLPQGKFDKNHIALSGLNADITIPTVSDRSFSAELFRITFMESAGLKVNDLHGKFALIGDTLSVSNLALVMPGTALRFSDMTLPLDSTLNIKDALSKHALNLGIINKSYVNPADLASFSPILGEIDGRLNIDLSVTASLSDVNLHKLHITSSSPHISVNAEGHISRFGSKDSISADISNLSVVAMGGDIHRLMRDQLKNADWLDQLGLISLNGNMGYDDRHVTGKLNAVTQCGRTNIVLNGTTSSLKNEFLPLSAKTEVSWEGVDMGRLLSDNRLGSTAGTITSNISISDNKNVKGDAEINIKTLEVGYTDIADLHFAASGDQSSLKFTLNSPNRNLKMQASGDITFQNNSIENADLRVELDNFSPSALGIKQPQKGMSYSGRLLAGLRGSGVNDFVGVCTLGNIHLSDSTGISLLDVKSAVLTASGGPGDREIKLRSDLVDIDITGSYNIATLPATLQEIAAQKLPAIFSETKSGTGNYEGNNFTLTARVKETEEFADRFKLPASLMYPMLISGRLNGSDLTASMSIDAPYIRQGNKIIEGTSLNLNCDSTGILTAHTKVPTKDGLMTINLVNNVDSDTALTTIDWQIDRKRVYRGNLGFATRLLRGGDNELITRVNILPGEMQFNDTVWTVDKASITAYGKDRIVIDHINASRTGQYVKIDGTVSASTDDRLKIDLNNVNLDYIFESLGIDKARIGGDATGTFTASALLSPEPHLTTPGLDVKNISYNATVLGDAIVKSRWDGERRAITLNAEIDQPNGKMSTIDGAIFPLNDSLDISFDAKEINIGFLKPFMEAFTSDVQGRASGQAHLWGNFKYIDFEGDLHADSIRMKIDFTNTWYTACDSVIITPGLIDLKDITLRDEMGHTGVLNGYVKHTFFKAPEFEFNITDVNHMLVYDETEKRNPDWYGRVFANGKASVKGGPGWVDITADMSTASQSVFTFVLSDMQEAGEYSFITFRDRNLMQISDSIVMADPTPVLVRDMRRRLAQKEEEGASRYDMDFRVAITPEAQLIIVMDPVGGDRIRAFGSGTLRMQYGSTDEELRMYGTYTLERGSYNFTLQDIIIKDFSIRDGSSIAFTGDPFAAILDITAVYALNANLSDLDESFLQDRDLNRTNVPVHAVLKVAGDLQQPDIAFDLEFPTLPSDTYRKVKSIVSTDEMMNRQIIYLLALSRFYTPDYVGATRGNELVSVASSTLSSQLSNILGQINDKWSIAPNFRSDKGDFSDLEVDLALSSQLLNNRLLFNGNFGYRDNTMNNNQFIGDFDIEYLLNRRGSLRLKAYNRYNDRNYYVKTATTTQGVGIVLRHDFDNFLSILKKYKKDEGVAKNAENADTNTVNLPEPTFSTTEPDSIK